MNPNPNFYPWRSPYGPKIEHFRGGLASQTRYVPFHVYIFDEIFKKSIRFKMSATIELIVKILRKSVYGTHEAQKVSNIDLRNF